MPSNEPLESGAHSHARATRFASVAIAALGVAGSGLLLWSLRAAESAGARSALEREATKLIECVRRGLTANVEQLHAAVALFDSSEMVERKEFRAFTARSIERHPPLRAVLWAGDPTEGGLPSFPVRYCEGPEAPAVPAGFDLGQQAALREALERCRKTQELALSAPFPAFTTEGGSRVGVLLPAYSRGEFLRGFIGGFFDVERLLEEAAGEALDSGLASRAEDVTGPTALPLAGAPASSDLVQGEFELGGRRWRITCSAPGDFVAARMTWRPWAALALGLLTTGLLAYTVTTAARRGSA